MWVFVFFDLPTNTPAERKTAATFRKRLMNGGFHMMQYSVYNRHCMNYQDAQVHIGRVKKIIPPEGEVRVLTITDKQFGDIKTFLGGSAQPPPETPEQVELF